MFHSVFERITYLEYQLKAKKDIIAALESEERYVKMQEEYRCAYVIWKAGLKVLRQN